MMEHGKLRLIIIMNLKLFSNSLLEKYTKINLNFKKDGTENLSPALSFKK